MFWQKHARVTRCPRLIFLNTESRSFVAQIFCFSPKINPIVYEYIWTSNFQLNNICQRYFKQTPLGNKNGLSEPCPERLYSTHEAPLSGVYTLE